MHGITNNSLRVDTSIVGYAGLLLGGRTILPGIANSSPRLDCFRNQYRRVRGVTPRWAYNFVWHRRVPSVTGKITVRYLTLGSHLYRIGTLARVYLVTVYSYMNQLNIYLKPSILSSKDKCNIGISLVYLECGYREWYLQDAESK